MAEVAIVASIIQIADVGLRLSIKYILWDRSYQGPTRLLSISKDVSLTSPVLRELSDVSKSHGEADPVRPSENAVKTVDEAIKECMEVFQEIETIIVGRVPGLSASSSQGVSKGATLLQKLKWPYLQPKIRLLQSTLDRLRATMLLMLNVIIYARQVSAR